MLIQSHRWVVLVTRALTVLVTRASAAESPPGALAARPLVRLTGSKAQIEAWMTQLCTHAELACAADPSKLTLYRTAGDPPSTVWGILSTGPILVRGVHGSGSDWSVQRRWDFSTYAHSQGCGGPTPDWEDAPTSLYPALYPVGPHVWAVAVVCLITESYAGGGAGFSVADFVVPYGTRRTTGAARCGRYRQRAGMSGAPPGSTSAGAP